MKNRSIAFICAGLLVVSVIGIWWMLHLREARRDWPGEQLRHASRIGEALSHYREAHGAYPERLVELVTGGSLHKEEYERYRFRAAPSATAEDWLYRAPNEPADFAVVSPRMIDQGSGQRPVRLMARADGSAEAILSEKSYRIPIWAAESKLGEQAAASDRHQPPY